MAAEKKKVQKKIRKRVPIRIPIKGAQAVLAAVFFFALLFISAGNLLHRDREFSSQEKRVLAQKPEMSLSNIASGRFMRQYEEYISDQFPGRELLLQIKTFADSISGKTKENGVFNGRDDYLMADAAAPDPEVLDGNLNAMAAFKERYADVAMHMMLVPNAVSVLRSKLPFFAAPADQREMIQEVRNRLEGTYDWIDAQKTMTEHREEDIYYRTDHHWTTLGAYYVFRDAREKLGLTDMEEIEMKPYGASNHFTGTLSAMSGYQTGYKEAIYIYLPDGDTNVRWVVNYVEEQKKSASLYDSASLTGEDQYNVFMGGNHALVDIKTTRSDGERLLVIKDSYANCFIPFLVPYYREVVVVDPRYYYGDLDQLMIDSKIDRVLFLYNANSFFEDRMLYGILSSGEDGPPDEGGTTDAQDSAGITE